MKLGFLTALFGDWELEKIFKFIAEQGYEAVEIGAWPWLKHLDLDKIIQEGGNDVKDKVAEYNLTITALTCHVNHLEPDEKVRDETNKHFRKVLKAAARLDVPVVTAVAGIAIPGYDEEGNWKEFKKVMGALVQEAGDLGVKIGIETLLPFMVFNIPTIERMFDTIEAANLGLNFDPSHSVWQGIDYLEVVRRFSERIFHSHGKDTEVRCDVLRIVGINGKNWWRFRIPGWGQVDWKKLITTYKEVGYDNVISFEHEDPMMGREEGVIKVAQFLKPLL